MESGERKREVGGGKGGRTKGEGMEGERERGGKGKGDRVERERKGGAKRKGRGVERRG